MTNIRYFQFCARPAWSLRAAAVLCVLGVAACGGGYGGGTSYSGGGMGAGTSAPVITVQPASQSVAAGAMATFSVTATGATGYQWLRNGAAISGATMASYTTPATTTADSGTSFAVQVSNAYGSVTSSPAILTVM